MRDTVLTTYRFLKDDVLYGALLYRYGVARHRALQGKAVRSQSHSYTCFYRSPAQLDALVGPVMTWLLARRPQGRLQIHVLACSTGAEPYTVASVITRAYPGLDVRISASDHHAEQVERTIAAMYSASDVLRRPPPREFIADTFERLGVWYRVRAALRDRVDPVQASLLDPGLAERLGPADVVFAQNVFCHLDPADVRAGFANVLRLLKPRAALFVDGMNLDLRTELTARAGLSPLDFKIREIHEYARSHVGDRWWNYYYGIEPYARWHPDRARRFATIFLQGGPVSTVAATPWGSGPRDDAAPADPVR